MISDVLSWHSALIRVREAAKRTIAIVVPARRAVDKNARALSSPDKGWSAADGYSAAPPVKDNRRRARPLGPLQTFSTSG
jgi:hypothetical protein